MRERCVAKTDKRKESITIEENDRDCKEEGGAVGRIDWVSRDKVVQAIKVKRNEATLSHLDELLELTFLNGSSSNNVAYIHTYNVLESINRLKNSYMSPTFVGQMLNDKRYILNCSCYGGMKLLRHRVEVVKTLLMKKVHKMETINEIQFCFKPVNGTYNAVFKESIDERYYSKSKSYVCAL